ncbi:DUF5677 domain-containing protein [Arsenicibacter rosenii]|uniref:Uncharacterized protein n=1 Tax=Arsenicibacter rosenii TaxID=1750698 RepID=A0A1S2VM28_9BACT|nr:DUF5677 domain-containing protein [Arsenicibacter rosenii]OIN59837.1 hypothetical protein BLX24_08235 [Arsenicibacter rosenii]
MFEGIEEIIPRKLQPDVSAVAEKVSSTVDSFVDMGSRLLKWDIDKQRKEEYHLPVLMSFRHTLEMADAGSLLIRHSSAEPVKALLRSMFETHMHLAYLLEKDTENRGAAFNLFRLLRVKDNLDKSDPSTQEYKQLKATFAADSIISGLIPPVPVDLEEQKQELERNLQKPRYADALKEYDRLRIDGNGKKRKLTWYTLFNDRETVNSIEELAKYLKLAGMYEVLYRGWSGTIHATDIYHGKVEVSSEGRAGIIQLRNPETIQLIGKQLLMMMLTTLVLYVNTRVPEKALEFKAWWGSVLPAFLEITGEDPLLTFE